MIEICLVILGVVAVVASFLLGEKISPEQAFVEEQVTELLDKQRKDAETRFHEAARQLSEDMQEATERELEKICNEKIMALHEDSDTTFEDIEKNHQEVVFLYSMLEDKKKELEDLTASLREETKETRELVQDLMLSKDITQMLEQEITMGREAIAEFKQLREDSEEALAAAQERIAQLRTLDEKLIDLQQLEARISLRQKEEKEREKEEKARAEKPAAKKTGTRRKAPEAKAEEDEAKQENPVSIEAEEGPQAEPEKEAAAGDDTAVKPARKTAARKKTAASRTAGAKAEPSETEVSSEMNGPSKMNEPSEINEPEEKPRSKTTRRKKPEGVEPEEKEALFQGMAASVRKEEPEPEENNFNQRILRMHRAGMTETEIAKSLSLGVGEVRLVIGLFEGAKR